MRRAPTAAQRTEMLREAERHERVAAALREVAEHGEPSAATLDAAPVLHEWTWDSDCTPVVVGGVGTRRDLRRSRGVLFMAPAADAVMTDDGWYRLGQPREAVIRRGVAAMSGPTRSLRESFPTLLEHAWDVSPPPGWEPLVRRLLGRLEALPEEERGHLRIAQVKSKFASLTVHYRGGGEAVRTLVEAAAEESQRTCEICGRPGNEVEDRGWYAVLCEDDEAKERAL